jgi:hypothetical protein
MTEIYFSGDGKGDERSFWIFDKKYVFSSMSVWILPALHDAQGISHSYTAAYWGFALSKYFFSARALSHAILNIFPQLQEVLHSKTAPRRAVALFHFLLCNILQELVSGNGFVLMCQELMTWQHFQNLPYQFH